MAEGQTSASWAGAPITFVLGAFSGSAIPWALLIAFGALPDSSSFLIFLAWLMPLLAFISMIMTFGLLSARYAAKLGTSPVWPIGGGIAGVVLQAYLLVEIFSNQE
jgi:hypothetical protein